MQANFIHLSSGIAVNIDQITHIDFRKKDVVIVLGANSVTAAGDDAADLREQFEPSPEEREAKTKARADKKAAAVKADADARAKAAKATGKDKE